MPLATACPEAIYKAMSISPIKSSLRGRTRASGKSAGNTSCDKSVGVWGLTQASKGSDGGGVGFLLKIFFFIIFFPLFFFFFIMSLLLSSSSFLPPSSSSFLLPSSWKTCAFSFYHFWRQPAGSSRGEPASPSKKNRARDAS